MKVTTNISINKTFTEKQDANFFSLSRKYHSPFGHFLHELSRNGSQSDWIGPTEKPNALYLSVFTINITKYTFTKYSKIKKGC